MSQLVEPLGQEVRCKVCGHSAKSHRFGAGSDIECIACPERICQDGPYGEQYRAYLSGEDPRNV